MNDNPSEVDSAAVYVGDPEVLDAEATWPGDDPFETHVERYCREHDVLVRPSRSSPTNDG